MNKGIKPMFLESEFKGWAFAEAFTFTHMHDLIIFATFSFERRYTYIQPAAYKA